MISIDKFEDRLQLVHTDKRTYRQVFTDNARGYFVLNEPLEVWLCVYKFSFGRKFDLQTLCADNQSSRYDLAITKLNLSEF